MLLFSTCALTEVFLIFVALIPYSLSDNPTVVWAAVGSEVKLRCPFASRLQGERAIIILWSKDSVQDTIYSYDARESSLLSGKHWENHEVLGTRANFKVNLQYGELTLSHVEVDDKGLYTCRVEYQHSGASYTRIQLLVIVPPNEPVISWKGEQVLGFLNPVREGEEISLVCRASGGYPAPLLVWFKEGKPMDARQEKSKLRGVDFVSSEISFTAEREVHLRPFVCQALPSVPSQKDAFLLSASVRLNLTLLPTSVEVSGLKGPISAETIKIVECLAKGSSPPAQIEIKKGENDVLNVRRTVLDGGNVTKASASIKVSRADHRANVTCRAWNPSFDNILDSSNSLMDVASLNVYYNPEVKLELGADLVPSEIIEGRSARLECQISANPPPHRIEWLKDGRPLTHAQGALLSGQTLTFQKLARTHSGAYRCSAHNLEGKTLSNGVEIKVKYTPVCAQNDKRTVGAAINRTVQLMCRVDSNPSGDLSFTWMRVLTSSGKEVPISSSAISIEDTVSYLNFTPSQPEDFGTFSCRASNTIGQQMDPCLILVVPSGPPESPLNCTVEIDSGTGLVTCQEGFNGGLHQTFILEAWKSEELLFNSSEEFPAWEMENLESSTIFSLKIYSNNAKGRSPPIPLFLETPPSIEQERKDENEDKRIDTMVILGSAVGFCLMLVVILLIILAICYQKRKNILKCLRSCTPTTDKFNANAISYNNSHSSNSTCGPRIVPTKELLTNSGSTFPLGLSYSPIDRANFRSLPRHRSIDYDSNFYDPHLGCHHKNSNTLPHRPKALGDSASVHQPSPLGENGHYMEYPFQNSRSWNDKNSTLRNADFSFQEELVPPIAVENFEEEEDEGVEVDSSSQNPSVSLLPDRSDDGSPVVKNKRGDLNCEGDEINLLMTPTSCRTCKYKESPL